MTDSPRTNPQRFLTTRWSMVVAAQRQDDQGQRALQELCSLYWPPVYAYFRRSGHAHDAANDLTQGLFLDLLERGDLGKATAERGRFRTFLLTCAQHFSSNAAARERALKRGGGHTTWSLSDPIRDGAGALDVADNTTPEREFERRWALTLLAAVLDRLEADYRDRGRGEVFGRLKRFLEAGSGEPNYAELAEELGLTPGSIKVTVHRMRRRYREFLVAELQQTLARPDDAIDEMEVLLRALGPPDARGFDAR